MLSSYEVLVASRAAEAFWDSVAAAFPAVQTGDVHPDSVVRLERAMREAISVWLEMNAE